MRPRRSTCALPSRSPFREFTTPAVGSFVATLLSTPCTTRHHPQFPPRFVREPRIPCTSIHTVHHASYDRFTPGAPRPRPCNELCSELTTNRHHLEPLVRRLADDERRTDSMRRTQIRPSENNITNKHLRRHRPDTGEVSTNPGNDCA